LDKCLVFTQKKEQYYNGNRNNFIFLFSCNANKFGINKEDALDYCLTNFDLDESEIKATVNSAYKNNIQDFAKYAKDANSNISTNENKENIENIENNKSELINMPYLPNHVFDKLPKILKKGCEVFKDLRERDVFFTGAITIVSGCMNTVSGGYRGKKNFANLFSFVIAPAASGKGALTFARDLGMKYHERLVAQSNEKIKE
ncbi:DUF3987 domain-containing protein, partial [Polaribacter sp. BAL334]|uniref:DUF3987 domain-containing protein n=1 Tax=Polaribacter sp. BAL334 TaxID=1708178 RepID=UPI0018D22953